MYSAYKINNTCGIFLVRWRIVIHGCVDGYSRRIIYIQASDNNKATTVLKLFTEAIEEVGLPKCVRADRGGENVEVARYMLTHPLSSRHSFITGRSIHNQRIERLWRDLFQSCVILFYKLFNRMEEIMILDVENEIHLFSLHYIFIPRINAALSGFLQAWNNHPLSSMRNLTPNQLWISGLTRNSEEGCSPHVSTVFMYLNSFV